MNADILLPQTIVFNKESPIRVKVVTEINERFGKIVFEFSEITLPFGATVKPAGSWTMEMPAPGLA